MEKGERWSWVLISTTVLCLGVLIGEQRAIDRYTAPPVCLEAFDRAEEIHGVGSGVINAARETIPDLARYDGESLIEFHHIVDRAVKEVDAIEYADARDECLADSEGDDDG